MNLMPWRRVPAGTDADDIQQGSPRLPRVTWAEAVLRTVTLGWSPTIRLCVIVLVTAVAGAAWDDLASWLGRLP